MSGSVVHSARRRATICSVQACHSYRLVEQRDALYSARVEMKAARSRNVTVHDRETVFTRKPWGEDRVE